MVIVLVTGVGNGAPPQLTQPSDAAARIARPRLWYKYFALTLRRFDSKNNTRGNAVYTETLNDVVEDATAELKARVLIVIGMMKEPSA